MRYYRSVIVLFAFLFVATLAGLSVLYPAYGEICEPAKDGQAKECATYGMTLFYFLKIGKALDAMSAGLTAIATAVVSYYTYTLWRTTDQQRKIAEQQKSIAEKAAEISEKQMLIATRQTDLQHKQHELGRLQFFATNRPRVRCKHVELKSNIFDGTPIVVNVTWINEGPVGAYFGQFGIAFFIEEKGQLLPPFPNLSPP